MELPTNILPANLNELKLNIFIPLFIFFLSEIEKPSLYFLIKPITILTNLADLHLLLVLMSLFILISCEIFLHQVSKFINFFKPHLYFKLIYWILFKFEQDKVPSPSRVRSFMCTPVTPAVPYLLLGLQGVQWAVGNSRGARKLARTPHVNQKKKKIKLFCR